MSLSLYLSIDEASDVDSCSFFPSPVQHSLGAGQSCHHDSGQVRVVIAMMTRKKKTQNVLAALFGNQKRLKAGNGYGS